MKVDWKLVCQSAGYKSIRKQYAKTLSSANRSKQRHNQSMKYDLKECTTKFAWIISRAIHYAHHKQTTVDLILNEWEEKRTYSWRSYYGDQNFPKLNPKSLYVARPSAKTYYLRTYKRESIKRKQMYCAELKRLDALKTKRTGSKARWSKLKKLNHRRYKRSP